MRYGKVSNKAHNVCRILQEDIPQITTPSQSGIYKAMQRSMVFEESYIENLKNENWSLHFDGKLINKVEHQVVVLKNEARKLGFLFWLQIPNHKQYMQ